MSSLATLPDLFDLPTPLSARRIVVAMSGGVDSSVVAGLAARTGAEVIGVTLQLYDYGAATGRKGACCAGDDIRGGLQHVESPEVADAANGADTAINAVVGYGVQQPLMFGLYGGHDAWYL